MVHEVELMAGGRGTGGKMLCQEAGVGVGQKPETILGGPDEVHEAVLVGSVLADQYRAAALRRVL
jgi:hypothetical protein